jgi:hypothetical protein
MQAQTRKWIGSMILCTVFLLPGTRVTGQPPKTAQATIPFEFWIGDTLLPAGDYQIEHVVSSTLVMFRSKNGKTSQDAYMIPLDDSVVNPDQAKLVFQVQNGRHSLYALWGINGKRVMTSESGRPAPAKENLLDVPVVYR